MSSRWSSCSRFEQHAQLGHRVGAERVRLVDADHRTAPFRAQRDQLRIELAHALAAIRRGRLDAELLRDARAQAVGIDAAQRHEHRDFEGLRIELLGQRARHRGGAAADRADQHAQFLALLDAAAQPPARRHVRTRAEPELELRLVAEGVAREAEAFQMLHGFLGSGEED